MVIWLIGLSGSGKTTVGAHLYEILKPRHPNLVFLDGDVLREVWDDQLGHDMDGRQRNAGRISRLCQFLDRQNIHVIAAVLSIFAEWQAWNRAHYSRYFEIFLDVPFDVLKTRDSRGLYGKAERGEIKNVVGFDIDFPRPANPDLVIEPPEVLEAPNQIVKRILEHCPGP